MKDSAGGEEEWHLCRGAKIRLTSEVTPANTHTRKQWGGMFKVLQVGVEKPDNMGFDI